MKYLLFVLFIVFYSVNISFAQKSTDEMKEFADGSYLQIDNLDVPKGIRRVEEQLRENVIDVILHSKIHMPIFAQKRPEGYSKEYKKFYGLNIRILPILGDEDFYSLQLFYYNWTTNKFDKKLVKKISRYNVLNELRFATYEIIMGKQWVVDHKDQIESRNFDRIQAVREVISQNERMRKKKQNEEEKKKEQLEEENETKRARSLIKREEREKKNKKEEKDQDAVDSSENKSNTPGIESLDQLTIDPEIEKMKLEGTQQKQSAISKSRKSNKKSALVSESEMVMEEQVLILPDSPIPGHPKKTYLYGFANYFQEDIEIGGIIQTSTTLKYLGAGGKFILESQDKYPTGMRFSILAASPIFKEKYKLPIYRAAESEYFVSKILGHVKLFAGLDFVPVYFVGLPEAGAGFQVYENDFLWGKIGTEVTGDLYDRSFEIRAIYSKSLISKSNQKGTFDATKLAFSAYSQIKNNHGVELNMSTMNAAGPFSVFSKKIALSYVYKFEN